MVRLAAPLSLVTMLVACSGESDTDEDACREGEPSCVEGVIDEMDDRFGELAADCDHDAIFALLYLRTTETFLATLDTIGYSDPAAVVREDAVFADYYFAAFDAFHGAGGVVPPAWQIAFTAADERAVKSPGNALLGFNAHIQRDLPFVLHDLHVAGGPIGHEDHTLVNDFLAQVDVAAEIADRFDPIFDDAADPEDVFPIIVAWRETAFTNFERLRDAPDPDARAEVAADIEADAEATAAALAQSTAYPSESDSSARDAYCEKRRD